MYASVPMLAQAGGTRCWQWPLLVVPYNAQFHKFMTPRRATTPPRRSVAAAFSIQALPRARGTVKEEIPSVPLGGAFPDQPPAGVIMGRYDPEQHHRRHDSERSRSRNRGRRGLPLPLPLGPQRPPPQPPPPRQPPPPPYPPPDATDKHDPAEKHDPEQPPAGIGGHDPEQHHRRQDSGQHHRGHDSSSSTAQPWVEAWATDTVSICLNDVTFELMKIVSICEDYAGRDIPAAMLREIHRRHRLASWHLSDSMTEWENGAIEHMTDEQQSAIMIRMADLGASMSALSGVMYRFFP